MLDTISLILYGKQLKINPEDDGSVEYIGNALYKPTMEQATPKGYIINRSKKVKHLKKNKPEWAYSIRIDESNPRGRQIRVNIEFSIPKLILGSSLYEVELNEENYNKLINKLYTELSPHIIDLSKNDLETSVIKRIDFCRNIILPEKDSEINWIIGILATYDLNARYDLSKKDYQNDERKGTSISFFNKSQAIKFYNKLEEIQNLKSLTLTEQSIKKALDKRTTSSQVFRIERSLQRYQTVNYVLSKFVDKKSKFTLKDIWDEEMAKKILLELVEDIVDKNISLFTCFQSPDDATLINDLLKTFSLGDVSKIYMMKKLVDQIGTTGTKKLLQKHISRGSYDYTLRKLRAASKILEKEKAISIGSTWSNILDQLRNNEFITSENWKDKILDD